MTTATHAELTQKQCVPCESGGPVLRGDQLRQYLAGVPKWELTAEGKSIRRRWRVKDFVTAIEFFNRVGKLAESENHHPDLHLTGFRDVAIELSTHEAKGLTQNDFILAAKIDMLPVALKT